MSRFSGVVLLSSMIFSVGCSAASTGYQTEFGGVQPVGMQDTSNMTRGEMHAAIERAYLDGELTTEEARKAHTQLDVKGHLTQEQIRVIHRDRLAKRDEYETHKEQLDVIRDYGQTGTSVTGDINNIITNIKGFFHH